MPHAPFGQCGLNNALDHVVVAFFLERHHDVVGHPVFSNSVNTLSTAQEQHMNLQNVQNFALRSARVSDWNVGKRSASPDDKELRKAKKKAKKEKKEKNENATSLPEEKKEKKAKKEKKKVKKAQKKAATLSSSALQDRQT